jgi:twinkle protein
MSQLEKTALALDELALRRKSNVLPQIDFVQYLNARQLDKDNVKRPHEFADEIMARFSDAKVNGASMPWTKTHDQVRFRSGEVSMWSGYNGHKKSMVLGYISLGFIQQNEPVCIASFEMKPSSTIARMLIQATGTNKPTTLALDEFLEFSDGNLWLYDQQGSVTPEQLYGVIYYTAEKLGVKHFIIDSLMRVVSGDDDYNAQKNFVTRLCAIAQETNIHIHFVHHNKKGDETKPAGRYEAKGSSSLSDNVHNAFNVWSKKEKKEDEEFPDVVIRCDKQREGEWEGTIGLWFLEESLQFSGTQEARTRTWIR